MLYRQCILRKDTTETTSWLPEKYAIKGKFLKLKIDDGWEVIEVGASMSEKEAMARSQDYNKTRKATDI